MSNTELLSIRLPDGQIVLWTPGQLAAHEDDWHVNLAQLTPEEAEIGIARLMRCLAHEDGEKCEVCSGDD